MRSKLAALVRRHPPPSTAANQTSTNGVAADSSKSLADNSGGGGGGGQTSSATTAETASATLRALLQKGKRGVIRGSVVEQYFRTSKNPYVYHLLPSTVPVCKIEIAIERSPAHIGVGLYDNVIELTHLFLSAIDRI